VVRFQIALHTIKGRDLLLKRPIFFNSHVKSPSNCLARKLEPYIPRKG
jgi:hypothetical protein